MLGISPATPNFRLRLVPKRLHLSLATWYHIAAIWMYEGHPCSSPFNAVELTDVTQRAIELPYCSPDGADCGAIRVYEHVFPDFRLPSGSIRATAYAVAQHHQLIPVLFRCANRYRGD